MFELSFINEDKNTVRVLRKTKMDKGTQRRVGIARNESPFGRERTSSEI